MNRAQIAKYINTPIREISIESETTSKVSTGPPNSFQNSVLEINSSMD